MSYQQVILIGNPGADAEMSYTPGGKAVAKFNMAVNKRWTGTDGQKQDKTTWFKVTFWDKQAEIVANYVKKGKQVMVIGEIEEARAFTDKSGELRASLEVTGRTVQFLSSAAGGEVTVTSRPAAPVAQQQEEELIPF